MNIVEILLGIIIGAAVMGAVLFGYFMLKIIKSLTDEIRRFNENLIPLLESEELAKGLRSFRALAELGEEIGRKMDSLNATIRVFYQFAMNKPDGAGPGPMAVTSAVADSGVFGYSEETAASLDAARGAAARKEVIDSRVSGPPEDNQEVHEPF